jgi:PAS domain S-box-containing protein
MAQTKQIQTVNQNKKSPGGPLLCWDIFMECYHTLIQKADDIRHLKKMAKQQNWKAKWDFQKELVANNYVIVVTNPASKIVFASHNIFEMTGYTAKELKGKNPKTLQGEKTDPSVIAHIKEGLTEAKPFETVILNYKKNGRPYHCRIKGFPVFNKKDELVNFIAFEQAA